MSLDALLQVPDEVRHADALVARLDRCLVAGFSRLGSDEIEALAVYRRTFAGTPLGDVVGAAVEAFGRSEYTVPHFRAIAAARAALQGAMHDALLAQAASVLGRQVVDGEAAPRAELEPASVNLLDAARHWLVEVAIGGLARVDPPSLLPFSTTLDRVQESPALIRAAALLTGFWTELVEAAPIDDPDAVPARRWADLWTRAMLAEPAVPASVAVSGRFEPLAVEPREHANVVSFVVHGLLRDPPRHVRTTLTAWKVDVVEGPERWKLFRPAADALLEALAGGRALTVTTQVAGADLAWGDAADAGPLDVVAAAACLRPDAADAPDVVAIAAVDRHPVQIAVPVLLDADGPLPIEGSLDLAKATSVLGLLRFDGGRWFVEALGAGGKKGFVHHGALALGDPKKKAKEDVVGTLRERASRLLRK